MIGTLLGANAGIIDIIITVLMRIPAVLIAICVHEAAHGYIAYKLGDPTAKLMGRVTINPLAHFDLLGALCMLFFGFGWAKPVPFDFRQLKRPKRDTALIAAAGPISNLIVAFIFAGLWIAQFYVTAALFPQWFIAEDNAPIYILISMLEIIVQLNIGLMLFNLLPIPPLDGSKVLFSLLPARAYRFILVYERYGMGILMLWIILGDRLPWFLDLSYWISIVATHVLSWIVKFWAWLFEFVLSFIV